MRGLPVEGLVLLEVAVPAAAKRDVRFTTAGVGD